MKLVLKKHDGVWVVRDDLYPYGSKARFLDDYFDTIPNDTVVYGGSPRWGFAQISIAYLAKRHGKKAVIFIAESKELSPYSQRAKDLGAEIVPVSTGFLVVCEAKARNYAHDHDAHLLPFGLRCPQAIDGVVRVAKRIKIKPDEVWTVASSGTLSCGLQAAFPDAEFYAVQVGKQLDQSAVGRATIIKAPESFNKPAKNPPPFPSVPEYDAKAWQFIPKDAKKTRLFWNVGS